MTFEVVEGLVMLIASVSLLAMLIGANLIKKETNEENSKKLKLGKTLKTAGGISFSVFGAIETILIIISFTMT